VFTRSCKILWNGDIEMKKLTIISLLQLQKEYEQKFRLNQERKE
jgi:hypothetical protein